MVEPHLGMPVKPFDVLFSRTKLHCGVWTCDKLHPYIMCTRCSSCERRRTLLWFGLFVPMGIVEEGMSRKTNDFRAFCRTRCGLKWLLWGQSTAPMGRRYTLKNRQTFQTWLIFETRAIDFPRPRPLQYNDMRWDWYLSLPAVDSGTWQLLYGTQHMQKQTSFPGEDVLRSFPKLESTRKPTLSQILLREPSFDFSLYLYIAFWLTQHPRFVVLWEVLSRI